MPAQGLLIPQARVTVCHTNFQIEKAKAKTKQEVSVRFSWTVTDGRLKLHGGTLSSGYLSRIGPGWGDYKHGA